MAAPPLHVLFEDNHCLVVAKPARTPVAGDESGDESLLDRAKAYLKATCRKPGDVYLGLVHRLDRPVSGVVLFARTSKAAARLSAQFREGTVEKVYVALLEAVPDPPAGTLRDWLLKDEARNVSRAVPPGTTGAKDSELSYRVMETLAAKRAGSRATAQVEIVPRTGRSHQIRVQFARRGWPIVGDRKYGATTDLDGAIALHATRLTFGHPTLRTPVTVELPPPAMWTKITSDRPL